MLGSRAPTPIISNFSVDSKQAIQSIKSGKIITVVLVSSFRALEHFFSENNKTTLLILFGAITSDIIKLGISGATTIFSLTSGPLFLAIGVSLVVGNILNHIDNKYEITQKFKLALEKKKTLNESLKQEEMRINDVIGRSYIKNGVFL